MNLKITDKVGFSIESTIKLVQSLFSNRAPSEGSFDYGFETHGAIGLVFGVDLPYPVQVWQTNKRKSDKSPIHITIEKHLYI